MAFAYSPGVLALFASVELPLVICFRVMSNCFEKPCMMRLPLTCSGVSGSVIRASSLQMQKRKLLIVSRYLNLNKHDLFKPIKFRELVYAAI